MDTNNQEKIQTGRRPRNPRNPLPNQDQELETDNQEEI
jgi:hypothetical protein